MNDTNKFEDNYEPVVLTPLHLLPNESGLVSSIAKLRRILSYKKMVTQEHDNVVVGDTIYMKNPEQYLELAKIEAAFLKSHEEGSTSTSPTGRGNTLEALKGVMGEGPLTLPTDEEWRVIAAILGQFIGTYGMKHEDMIGTMERISEKTAERLTAALEANQPVDVLSIFKAASYEIVLEGVIGVNPDDIETQEYFKSLTTALATTIFPTQIGIKSVDWMPVVGRKRRESIKILEEYTDEVIELAEKSQKRNLINTLRTEGVREEVIKGTIHQVIAAGHETTAGTTTAVLYEIVKDPELWDKLAAELKENQVDYRNFKAVHDLLLKKNDSLLYRVLNEVLRMYPPTYLIPSSADEDIVVGGILIPKGTQIQINMLAGNRHPDFFTEPDEFDPDRVLPGSPRYNEKQFKALKPFWAGARRCAGERMAMIEMAMLIVTILQTVPRMKLLDEGYISLLTGVTTRQRMKVGLANNKPTHHLHSEI